MDFLLISRKPLRGGGIELYPHFKVRASKDLMIKGGKFYAFGKRAFDIFASLMAIIILALPMLIISYIKKISRYETEESIDNDDHLLTLITCVEHQPRYRQVVLCRELERSVYTD